MPRPPPTHPVQHAIASAAPARRPRLLALGLIVLLHAAGLWWLRSEPGERRRPAREAAHVTLRVLPGLPLPGLQGLPAPAARRPAALPPLTPTPTPTPAARPARPGPVPARPAANDAPPPPPRFDAIGTAPAAAPAPAVPAQAGTAPHVAAPLDLRLPRAASAPLTPGSLARSDARANTPGSRSLGERLSSALGSDGRIVEEAMNDGRVRIRRGAGCVELHPARGAQLDPFDQAVRATPRTAKACD